MSFTDSGSSTSRRRLFYSVAAIVLIGFGAVAVVLYKQQSDRDATDRAAAASAHEEDQQAATLAEQQRHACRDEYTAVLNEWRKAQHAAIRAEFAKAFADSLTPEKLATYNPPAESGKLAAETGRLRMEVDKATVEREATQVIVDLEDFSVEVQRLIVARLFDRAANRCEQSLETFKNRTQLCAAHLEKSRLMLYLNRPDAAAESCKQAAALFDKPEPFKSMQKIIQQYVTIGS